MVPSASTACFGHRLDLVVVGDVGGDRHQLVARGGRLLDGGLVGLGPTARDGDPGARLREAEGEGLAEALVAAGDERGLAVEAER